MSDLIAAILTANGLGYAVKIKREINQQRITCIYKDNTSFSSTVPIDHFTESQVVKIITYNIERHKELNPDS